MQKVVSGEFNPDATRSGMFKVVDVATADEVQDDLASSSCGSEDEDDADFFEEEKVVEEVAGRWQPDQHDDQASGFVRHVTCAFTRSWTKVALTWLVAELCR